MLDDVFFVSMEGRNDYKIGDFTVREDIPLPVVSSEDNKFTPEDITPDNIILGMLRVLRDNPDNENMDYYRDFIYSVKPDIDSSLTAAAFEAEGNGDYIEALNIYRGLVALNPSSIDHILNVAVCYDEYSLFLFEKGKDAEALKMEELAYEYFKQIDSIDNKNDRSYYYLGRFYFARENYEKAVYYFNDFIKETDDSERKNEVMKAIDEINKMGVFDDYYKSAYDLIQADKDQEAITDIDKFIEKYPDLWNGYYLKGLALRKLEKFDEAIVVLNKAITYNDTRSDLYNELGVCYMNVNNFSRAEISFSRALRYNDEDLAVYYNLAMLSYRKGDKKEALKYCEVILDIDNKDLKTKELMQYIENQGGN